MQVPYDNTQVSSDPVTAPRVQTDRPIEQFGGGDLINKADQGAQGLIENVNSIEERSFRAAQEATKMNHQNNANTVGLDALYGTKDSQGNDIPGILQRISGAGPNAHAVYDEGMQEYDKLADQQIATAKSDQEAAVIRNIYADKKSEMQKVIQPHIAGEMQKYEKGAADASVSGFQDTASGAYAHTDIIDAQVQKLKDTRDSYAATHGGVDAPQNQQQKSEDVSNLYKNVVEKYFNNGQDVQGRQYYEQIKDQVTDAKISGQLDKMVRDGSMDGDAQRIVNGYLDKYTDKGAMNEEIRNISDPQLQDKVRAKADPQFAIKMQKTQIEKDNNLLQGQDIAMKKGFEQIPKSLLGTYTDDEVKALQTISNNNSGAIPIKNNDKVFNEYIGMTPHELSNLKGAEVVRDVRPYLDDYHFNQFQEKWQDSHAGIGGDQEKLNKVNNVQGNQDAMVQSFSDARIAGSQPGYGLNHINTSPKMRVEFNKFRDYVQQQVNAEQLKKKGEPLSPDEFKAIATQSAMRNVTMTVPGSMFGTNEVSKNISQLSSEERKNYSIPISKLADTDKQQIYKAGILSGGIPPTMSPSQAEQKYRALYEKAAGAAAMGATPAEISAIMGSR